MHCTFVVLLRDSPMITVPYFEVVQIIPAIEDGYIAFERGELQAGMHAWRPRRLLRMSQ